MFELMEKSRHVNVVGSYTNFRNLINQGTMGCTPNSVPMVFIVFSRDSWG